MKVDLPVSVYSFKKLLPNVDGIRAFIANSLIQLTRWAIAAAREVFSVYVPDRGIKTLTESFKIMHALQTGGDLLLLAFFLQGFSSGNGASGIGKSTSRIQVILNEYLARLWKG